MTHFLMGIIRILQKKQTTALAHIRAAVILDPLFQPAVAVLHALKCLNKVDNETVLKFWRFGEKNGKGFLLLRIPDLCRIDRISLD